VAAEPLYDDGPDVPWWAREFAARARLAPDQLRWCVWCHAVAYAIDEWQCEQLDALGFTDGLCPDCKCPPGP
jgi:hypothetical protein